MDYETRDTIEMGIVIVGVVATILGGIGLGIKGNNDSNHSRERRAAIYAEMCKDAPDPGQCITLVKAAK